MSTLPPLGQQIRYGRVDVPDPEPPTYRRWIPSIAALQSSLERDVQGTVIYGTPSRSGAVVAGVRLGFARGFHLSQADYIGVDYTDYDEALTNGAAFVGETAVDRKSVASTLSRTRYERDGRYDGYDIYTRIDQPRVVAVGDDAVVMATGSALEHVRDRVATTIDTSAGRIDRRHEVDGDFAALTDRLGARPFTWIGAGNLVVSDPVEVASTATFDSQAVYFVYEHLFESAAATPTRQRIKRHLTSEQRALQAVQTDISIDGRYVTIEMRTDIEPLRRESGSAEAVPSITWGFDYDSDASQVTLHHEAGTAVDYARLSIDSPDAVRGADPFADDSKTLTPGDSVTVDLTSTADRVAVAWASSDGDTKSVILNYSLDAR